MPTFHLDQILAQASKRGHEVSDQKPQAVVMRRDFGAKLAHVQLESRERPPDVATPSFETLSETLHPSVATNPGPSSAGVTQPSPIPKSSLNSSLNVAVVVGAIISGLVVLALIIIGTILYRRRRRKTRIAPSAEFMSEKGFSRVPSFTSTQTGTSVRRYPSSHYSQPSLDRGGRLPSLSQESTSLSPVPPAIRADQIRRPNLTLDIPPSIPT